MSWKGIVGKGFTPKLFAAYVDNLQWSSWRPKFLVLHNTAAPSLATRPDGFTAQHMRNLEGYYRDKQGWPSGPHLFIDDKLIWVFTDLRTAGTHSPSWNSTAIGIEMLGDFSHESFSSGRGKAVRQNTTWAMAKLSRKLNFRPDGWKFHYEDAKTTHGCPGKNARVRPELIKEISHDMEFTMRAPSASWDDILPDSAKGK